MPTECNPALFEFAAVGGRAVVAAFDGGAITSNAGALLVGATDRGIGLVCGASPPASPMPATRSGSSTRSPLWSASGSLELRSAHTQFAETTCGTLRLALLRIGAQVRRSVRRIKLAMASAHPFQDEFALAHARLTAAGPA